MLLLCFLTSFSLASVAQQDDKPDLAVVKKIREEGLTRSKVMETAFYLTDVNGPRLQGPGFMKAANWSKNKLAEWGLQNAKLESWGEWGKGWEIERSYIAMTAPYYKTIIAVPRAWSGGTEKMQQAEVLYIDESD
ncbi:MAG: peptidase M28, partial [Sphingobacteriales bacterium]